MDLSAVIVNYNAGDWLLACLDSAHRQAFEGTWEVILVDNASSDGSLSRAVERFPAVRTVSHGQNVGFSRGVNAGIARSSGRYVFVLNPDAILASNVFAEMVTFMDRYPEAGIAGCRVLNPDGSLQMACRRNIPTPAMALVHLSGLSRLLPARWGIPEYKIERLDPETPAEVGAVSGSCMVIRRAAMERVGLFDEAFFMYGEDLDYCQRMRQAGWKVLYHPGAAVTHYLGVSSATNPDRALREFYRAMRLFYRKHYAREFHPVFNRAVYLAIAGLEGLARLHNRLRKRQPAPVPG